MRNKMSSNISALIHMITGLVILKSKSMPVPIGGPFATLKCGSGPRDSTRKDRRF